MPILLIATTVAKKLYAYDVASGSAVALPDTLTAPIAAYTNGAANPVCAAASADGALFAVGSSGSGAHPNLGVFDTATWARTTFNIGTTNDVVNGVAFNPAGTIMAVVHDESPYLNLYDTSDWSAIATPASPPPVSSYACAFSPDGTKLAVGHYSDGGIYVYNTSDWSKVTLPAGVAGTVRDVAFSPDGSMLAVAHGTSPFLTVYNTSDWSKVTLGTNPAGGGYGCAFRPSGGQLAFTTNTSPYAHVYDTSTWARSNMLTAPPGACNALAYTPDSGTLYVRHSAAPYISGYNSSTRAKLTITPDLISEAGASSTDLVMLNAVPHTVSTSGAAAVTDDTNTPAVRAYRIYRREDGVLLASGTTNSSGEYAVSLVNGGEVQVVFLDDTAGTLYNDLIIRAIPS